MIQHNIMKIYYREFEDKKHQIEDEDFRNNLKTEDVFDKNDN